MTVTTPAVPARPGAVLPPLRIGPLTIDTPVVLAPMAGVTNAAFRRLCRESGAGLYVAEMVTSRALVERGEESMRIISHEPDERPRSVQVYGVDPATVGAAVRLIASEDRADHVDLNFGCPVPKVTRRGGGAVLPWKRDLFRAIITAAVDAARPYGVPVTVKMRKGIDDDHLTYLEAGLVAQEVGVAAVALHARTAADYYSGTADWDAIAQLKADRHRHPGARQRRHLVRRGRPGDGRADRLRRGRRRSRLPGPAVAVRRPRRRVRRVRRARSRPGLGYVATIVRRHAELMVEHFGDEGKALREMRKHMAWYFKGYVVGGETRAALGLVSTMAELDDRLGRARPGPGLPGCRRRGPARPGRVAQATAAAVRLAGLAGPVPGVREGAARGRAERLGRLTPSTARRGPCDRRVRSRRSRAQATRQRARSDASPDRAASRRGPRPWLRGAEVAGADRHRARRRRAGERLARPGRPSSTPLSSPARNASPAPLVSTTSSTGAAGTSIQPSASSARAPAPPSVHTASRHPRATASARYARGSSSRAALTSSTSAAADEVARVVADAVVVVHVAPDRAPRRPGRPTRSGRLWSARSRTAASTPSSEGSGRRPGTAAPGRGTRASRRRP